MGRTTLCVKETERKKEKENQRRKETERERHATDSLLLYNGQRGERERER